MQQHQAAFESYEKATFVRPWAPSSQVARALRGQGSALIELGRWDEAERAYQRSLELEPTSELALKELEFIREARVRQATQQNQLPWFAHAVMYPPSDPLTVELLLMVEDLEPIPGPQTIGPENYSKVADAFLNRGWQGFEEAFDSVIARTRQDYAEVKRELLREPIFNRKTHLNMTRVLLGEMTVEELIEQADRSDTRKTQ